MSLSLMQEFDFNELENSTEYDGGFSRYTPCVHWLIMTMFLMQEFDFNELENSTEYDGGFSRDTPCVRWLIMSMFLMQEFDFNELENSTEYDGGFSRDTPCVRWFWETVHGESKPPKNRSTKEKYLARDRTVKSYYTWKNFFLYRTT
jgi:hypothetical protein